MPAEEINGTGEQLSAITDLGDVGVALRASFWTSVRSTSTSSVATRSAPSSIHPPSWNACLARPLCATLFRARSSRVDIAGALPILQRGEIDPTQSDGLVVAFKVISRQCGFSWGVSGDNTPEKARELGYVTSNELWPEMEFVRYRNFLRDVVEGRGEPVYED